MHHKLKAKAIEQLKDILSLFESLREDSPHQDLSGPPESEHHRILSQARAAIERIAGSKSTYARQASAILDDLNKGWIGDRVFAIVGVVESLLSDVESDCLEDLAGVLHGEVFGDLLEMADHLLAEGYKDPAAMLASGALEGHLRRLCENYGVPVETITEKSIRFKNSAQINSELSAAEGYSKLDQKNVTAWLDIRNRAAHGKYDEYLPAQVSLLIAGVRDFISRNPG